MTKQPNQSSDLLPDNPAELDACLNEALTPLIGQSLKPASGGLGHPYLVPGGYDQAWDWDSYFIAEALADRPEAWPHIRGVVEAFFSQKNTEGRIPRWVHPTLSFWDSSCLNTEFGRDLAKPFLAQTALVYCRATGDCEWFRPHLKDEMVFLETWRRERMGADGLHAWSNGLESGGDNHPDVYCWPDNTVEGVDLAVFLIREHLAAGTIARQLGEFGMQQFFISTARFLLHQLEDLLYDPEANAYYNRWRVNGRLIRIQTETQFYPLWLGPFLTLDRERRRAMLRERLLDPARFWSDFGVRSISREDPIYNNSIGTGPSNWQGPVWIVANHIQQMILIENGLNEEALRLAVNVQRLLLRDLRTRGQMAECYSSEDGSPLAVGGFVGWNLLARHMVQDALAGRTRSIIQPC